MTEQQWLASEVPQAMLGLLVGEASFKEGTPAGWRKLSDRKLRLFACAVARAVGVPEHRLRVGDVEQWADVGRRPVSARGILTSAVAAAAASFACASMFLTALGDGRPGPADKAALLRDIAGNPFRP